MKASRANLPPSCEQLIRQNRSIAGKKERRRFGRGQVIECVHKGFSQAHSCLTEQHLT